jgi:tripartite-type tricarboxylate transporter receptor subunit TctC
MAPIGTTQKIINSLNSAVKIVLSGEAGKILRDRGYEPIPTTPEDFTVFLKSEIERWSKVVKDNGIKSDE